MPHLTLAVNQGFAGSALINNKLQLPRKLAPELIVMHKEMEEMKYDNQLKLMAAGIYEIRTLLSSYLGSQNDADTVVRLAAHLSYALHNEALNILEGDGTFDIKAALEKIKAAEKVVDSQYADNFGILGVREKA